MDKVVMAVMAATAAVLMTRLFLPAVSVALVATAATEAVSDYVLIQ